MITKLPELPNSEALAIRVKPIPMCHKPTSAAKNSPAAAIASHTFVPKPPSR